MGFEELARELKQAKSTRVDRFDKNGGWVNLLIELIRAMPRDKLQLIAPELIAEAIIEAPDIIELLPEEILDKIDIDAIRYAVDRIGGPVAKLIRAIIARCG